MARHASTSPPGLFRRRTSTIAVILGACAVAFGYVLISTLETVLKEREERLHFIELTDAFTRAYTEIRSDDMPIPATFRRIGLSHFTGEPDDHHDHSDHITLRMPGVPGQELNTVEPDPRLRAIIADLASENTRRTINEHRFEGGELIGRTIMPSIANNQSCVDCHNAALGADVYALGDTMGAFVVETDLTEMATRNLFYTLGAFGCALAGGLMLARRERMRMRDTVDVLEGQVKIEKHRREAEAYASFLASHDALTGLPNRNMFRETLDRLIADVDEGRTDDVMAVIVDLDDFKLINDGMGHDAGDALLTAMGKRLADISQQRGGTAARLGGDEFAMVVPGARESAAPHDLGAEIFASLHDSVSHDGRVLYPKASIGIARRGWLPDASGHDLLKAADMALYAVKSEGKDGYRVFDTELSVSMGRRNALAAALPGAIERGEVRAALQPQIDLSTGLICGFEALARWRWNDEDIAPDEFVAIAEETGRVQQLDLAVLRSAARFAVDALDIAGGATLKISSNVSAVDFADPELDRKILAALDEAGLAPGLLTLEVTESVLMGDKSLAETSLQRMREAGIGTALDDFGTGYSSLSYLTRFPFDTIKIDRAFVTDLTGHPKNQLLLGRIVDLSTDLDKIVVVEGIETLEQEALVKAKGAHIAQGFLYAAPLERDAALALIREQADGAARKLG